jgi:beta-catenin-like protein 1
VLAKFAEDDMVKLERLCELEAKYRALVGDLSDDDDEGDEGDEDEEAREERLLARLDAGLFVLQLVALVLAEVCRALGPPAAQRTRQLLALHDSSPAHLARVLTHYAATLGDGDGDGAQDKARVEALAAHMQTL